MRKSRIDELPQLFNVIRGDMNIVGPRPERPSIFVRLREQIDEYPVRQRVKPGITGLAQVSNPYDTTLEDVRRKPEAVSCMRKVRAMPLSVFELDKENRSMQLSGILMY